MNRCIICGKEIDHLGFDDRCRKCWNDLSDNRFISLNDITNKAKYIRTIPMNQREKEEEVSFSLKKGSVLCIISFIIGVILILLSTLII